MDDETTICGMCNGTGCRDCNNSGEVAVKADDDFEPPDDDREEYQGI